MNCDVAIIIVSYNSARQLGACLQSVFSECRRVTQEVIVLDNGSSDGTVALVRDRFPQVKLLTPGTNLGFAAGVNLAARHARADYLLLLNPDTVLLDRATDVIVKFARAHPRHGLYGGRTFKPDGTLEPSSCWGLPSLWSLAAFASGLSTLAPRNRWLDPESLGGWKRDTIREVGVVTGCFLLVRNEVWRQLGGFDERYFMYGEDIDLAIRARAAGWSPVICPDARLVHEVGQSSATPAAKMLLLYRGKASLVRQHWRGGRKHLGLFFLAAGVGLRALGTTIAGWRNRRTARERWQTVWRERRGWLEGYPARRPTTAQAQVA
jgi:GT2 family glycosyltransferase